MGDVASSENKANLSTWSTIVIKQFQPIRGTFQLSECIRGQVQVPFSGIERCVTKCLLHLFSGCTAHLSTLCIVNHRDGSLSITPPNLNAHFKKNKAYRSFFAFVYMYKNAPALLIHVAGSTSPKVKGMDQLVWRQGWEVVKKTVSIPYLSSCNSPF